MWEISISTSEETFKVGGTIEEVRQKFKEAKFWCIVSSSITLKIVHSREEYNKWYQRKIKENLNSEISISFDIPIALGDAVEGMLQSQGLEHLLY